MKNNLSVKMTFEGTLFVARTSYAHREVLSEAGFKWYPDLKAWATPNPVTASRLRQYADSAAKTQIERSLISVRPWVGGEITWSPPGLKPKPFQTKAAEWALTRNYSYLALDPGLGKTIVEALIINALPKGTPIVIVNQPGLCLNTEAELKKWCYGFHRDIETWPYSLPLPCDTLIVPDTTLSDPLGTLGARINRMTALGDAVLFVDEAQRFNSNESDRSKALFRMAERFGKIVFLSGTPMRNRPYELFPIISRFAGETIRFRNESQFGFDFCAGYFDSFGHPQFKGASRTEELFSALKETFMLRMRKADVLPELPKKTEEIVFLDGSGSPAVAAFEKKEAFASYTSEDLMKPKITNSPYMATYRRLLGESKIKAAIKFIQDILENGDEYVLVFAHHEKVIDGLAEGLADFSPHVVTGKTSKETKSDLVKSFQSGNTHLFIGSLTACGIGFTLTKATRVVQVEPSWVPADNDQANDRAHRIGQTQPVFIQHLVFPNSLDQRILETSFKKREVLNQL